MGRNWWFGGDVTGMSAAKVRKLQDVLRIVRLVQPGFEVTYDGRNKMVVFGPYDVSKRDAYDVRTHLSSEYGIKFANTVVGYSEAEAKTKIMKART
jgi:hypothetical protein